MTATPQPRLTNDAPDLGQFADDLAQLGPFTARDLAIQYLDQYLAPDQDFDKSVKLFTPMCKYYA